MTTQYKKAYIVQLSLDELKERVNQMDCSIPFEYRLGLYDVMDTETIGEIANIQRLLKTPFFTPKERDVIIMVLADKKLNATRRKTKERAIQKLKYVLLK